MTNGRDPFVGKGFLTRKSCEAAWSILQCEAWLGSLLHRKLLATATNRICPKKDLGYQTRFDFAMLLIRSFSDPSNILF